MEAAKASCHIWQAMVEVSGDVQIGALLVCDGKGAGGTEVAAVKVGWRWRVRDVRETASIVG